ncbi:uncharacterized protein LOC34618625 [Cyclospora cayetanensis]|uniref:Uncharacterized protein LOC34618625 n=1 Tax=Cyclospora cayetanensis TaxID=88456 RepID=A0A6P6S171_9EIME|nr:uncharacterized protein LOC34618625 [Cyclospora cayetanensis]
MSDSTRYCAEAQRRARQCASAGRSFACGIAAKICCTQTTLWKESTSGNGPLSAGLLQKAVDIFLNLDANQDPKVFVVGNTVSVSMLISKLQETDTAALTEVRYGQRHPEAACLKTPGVFLLGTKTASTYTMRISTASSEDETTRVLLALYWWGSLPLDAPTVQVTIEELELYAQALDLLLPAFSLFPEKEYMIILQPPVSGSSAASPLLSYFQLATRRSSSTLDHCLYILHRQSLLCPPIVQPITPKEWQEAASFAASAGIRLDDFKNCIVWSKDCMSGSLQSSSEASLVKEEDGMSGQQLNSSEVLCATSDALRGSEETATGTNNLKELSYSQVYAPEKSSTTEGEAASGAGKAAHYAVPIRLPPAPARGKLLERH